MSKKVFFSDHNFFLPNLGNRLLRMRDLNDLFFSLNVHVRFVHLIFDKMKKFKNKYSGRH